MTVPASELSDEALASRAQQGDRNAFEILIGRHKRVLYRLVRRYIGNSDDAYDLLQDTFIAVWENLQRFDPSRSFLAWTRTVALNKCRDFSRRQRFRRWISRLFAVEPSVQTPTPSEAVELTEGEAQAENRIRQLDQAIAALPALYREALLLTTVEGLSQEAAAAVLNTTTKSVEMRLRRARRKLSEALQSM